MIVIKENERLYLSNWQYNACRITSTLATIVENNGGTVKPLKTAIISNRTLEATKRDLTDKLAQLEMINAAQYNDKRNNYIISKRNELEKLEQIKNDPIAVSHTSYISFILNDVYYSYSLSDNPFFDFHYSKIQVINNKYSLDHYCSVDKKEWFFDCFFSFDVSDSDIKEAAHLIFNMLVNSPYSEKYRNSTRKRVPNLYDGGYHYENVYERERFASVSDWYK